LAWSEDGEKIASGSADGSIRIWSIEKIAASITQSSNNDKSNKVSSNFSVELIGGHTRSVNQLQWCPFNINVLASCSNDKSLKIWDISKNQPNILSVQIEIEILTLSWHPLKPILAVGTKDDRILFYQFSNNFLTANLIETLKFNSEVNEISWSANGNDLAVALGLGIVEIYRFISDSIEKLITLKAHTADCFCVRFKGDDLLAVGSSDSQVTLWSRSSSNDDFTCFRVLNRMEWPIRTLSFSHDTEFLAVGSEDPFIAIEHINTGSLVAKVSTGKANSEAKAGIPINSVAWHPSKHILAFAGSEVDDRTGKPTGSIKLFGLC
jgi:THO complex subunit 3